MAAEKKALAALPVLTKTDAMGDWKNVFGKVAGSDTVVTMHTFDGTSAEGEPRVGADVRLEFVDSKKGRASAATEPIGIAIRNARSKRGRRTRATLRSPVSSKPRRSTRAFIGAGTTAPSSNRSDSKSRNRAGTDADFDGLKAAEPTDVSCAKKR